MGMEVAGPRVPDILDTVKEIEEMAMDVDAGEVAVSINITETVIEAAVKAKIAIMDKVAKEAIMVANMVNNMKNGKI